MIKNVFDFIDKCRMMKIIEKRINPSNLAIIDSFKPQNKLVYTSFDGDYMNYLHHMQEYSMMREFTPINPEAALGYYVSTVSHHGKKVPVMMDCIKTELLCDYLWIFNPHSGHISEGVLAELMIWINEKKTDVSIIDFFSEHINQIDTYGSFHVKTLNHDDILSLLKKRTEDEIWEINEKLLIPYQKLKLENAYIISNFKNYKHIDWARNFCYLRHLAPVCSQTLLPYYLYNNPKYGNRKYIIDRLNILRRSDNILLFLNKNKLEDELQNLDEFSLCEIYYIIKYMPNKSFNIVGWDEALVPKYSNKKEWALTSIESTEV